MEDPPDYCFNIHLYGDGKKFTSPVWHPCGLCMENDNVPCRMIKMDQIRIVTRCTDGCKHCDWMFGSPRCLHPEMKPRNIEVDPIDPCLYQKVPMDSRKFHEECPLDKITMDRFEAEDGYNQCDYCKWMQTVECTEFPCIKCCHNTIADADDTDDSATPSPAVNGSEGDQVGNNSEEVQESSV